MARPAYQTGFTLIEMVTTLIILAILGAMSAQFLTSGTRAYSESRSAAELAWQGQVALERITRELRRARSATAADLVLTTTQLSFRDLDGNNVCFYVNGTTLMRSADFTAGACGATAPQALADNVQTLTVSYLRNDGVTPEAATVTNVSMVTALLTPPVAQGGAGAAVRATIHPRMYP